jgi:hypothetical protein
MFEMCQAVSGAQRSEQEGEVREPVTHVRPAPRVRREDHAIPASTSPTNEQDYL